MKVEVSYGFNIEVTQGDEVVKVRDIAGSVQYNKPDSNEEALQRFGEKILMTYFWRGMEAEIKRICKFMLKRGANHEDIQNTINTWVPGIPRFRKKSMTKEEMEVELDRLTKELDSLREKV